MSLDKKEKKKLFILLQFEFSFFYANTNQFFIIFQVRQSILTGSLVRILFFSTIKIM